MDPVRVLAPVHVQVLLMLLTAASSAIGSSHEPISRTAPTRRTRSGDGQCGQRVARAYVAKHRIEHPLLVLSTVRRRFL